MADQPTPNAVDRMNLALGALAAGLAAAIVAVIFLGTGDPASTQTTATSVALTTTSLPATTASVEVTADGSIASTSVPVTEPFVMPGGLTGTWSSIDGSTTAQFTDGSIDALQSMAIVGGQLVSLSLVESSALGAIPSALQPVQAVLFVTAQSETRLSPAEAVVAELVATDSGLRLTFELGGTMIEEHLRPIS